MKPYTQPVNDAADQLSADQSATFASQGGISTVLLEEGDRICRFVESKYGHLFSSFWMSDKTMAGIMSPLKNFDFARFNEKDTELYIRNAAKDQLAMMYSYDTPKGQSRGATPMFRMELSVKRPVIAYVGTAGIQKNHMPVGHARNGGIIEKRMEQRLGGGEQIVIPRFNKIRNEQGFEYTELKHFADIYKDRRHRK